VEPDRRVRLQQRPPAEVPPHTGTGSSRITTIQAAAGLSTTTPPSARSVSDAATTETLNRVHVENYGVYGIRKMHAELNRQGHRLAGAPSHG
jgi:hypothetical protein